MGRERPTRKVRRFDVEGFIEAWEDGDSTEQVANRLNITPSAAHQRYLVLRDDGYDLKSMRERSRNNRRAVGVHASRNELDAAEVAVPEGEIEALREGFDEWRRSSGRADR